MIIDLVYGTRPNLIKAAALYREWQENRAHWPFSLRLVDTGQHRDADLSENLRMALGLPAPEITLPPVNTKAAPHARPPAAPDAHTDLAGAAEDMTEAETKAKAGAGAGDGDGEETPSASGHPTQSTRRDTFIAAIRAAYRAVLRAGTHPRPHAVIAIGDVNGSLGIAQAAHDEGIFLIHLEAGLRGGTDAIAEEQNRIAIDHLADMHWAVDAPSARHLADEGIAPHRIFTPGNIMIDALCRFGNLPRQRADTGNAPRITAQYPPVPATAKNAPILFTLHRAENVDDVLPLAPIITAIAQLAQSRPIIWPLHPRTRAAMARTGLWRLLAASGNLRITPPALYPDFIAMLTGCAGVISDSGTLIDECAWLGIPALILRPVTERASILHHAQFIRLCRPDTLADMAQEYLAPDPDIAAMKPTAPYRPDGWDGHAALQMLDILAAHCRNGRAGGMIARANAG